MIIRFYSIVYEVAYLLARCFALIIPKLRQFLAQRATIEPSIQSFVKKNNHHVFWFHCASMGEFEQIKPLLVAIDSVFPKTQKVITFFSESGYSIHKNSPLADKVTYLPLDRKKNLRPFIRQIQPDALFLVKYEFWPNLIHCCLKDQTPIYVISSTFRKEQLFFKTFSFGMKSLLKQLSYFFVLNEESKKQLNSIGIDQVDVIGDTRIDRVLKTAKTPTDHKIIANFVGEAKCFIAGSTWPEDHALFISLAHSNSNVKWIIAPHKVDPSSIKNLEEQFTIPFAKWTSYQKERDENKNVLLLDCIGVLSSAYRYANYAYVGGAMGTTGLHNIFEATAFGIPVIIGKNYQRYPEAKDLITLGGVRSVNSSQEFEALFHQLNNQPLLQQQMGDKNKSYLMDNKGATSKIISFLKRYYTK